ncbi:hypothetical protein Emed_000742 [Eimeria media]
MSVRLARSVLLSRRQGRFPEQRALFLLPSSSSSSSAAAAAAAACCSRGVLSPRGGVPPHHLGCRLLSSSSSSSGPASAVSDAAVDGFLSGTAASYAEQMFVAWRRDPSSVHASWAAYFTNIENGLSPALAFSTPPPLYSSTGAHQPAAAAASAAAPSAAAAAAAAAAGGAAASGQSQQSALPIAPEAAGSLPFSALPHQSVHDTSRLIQMIRGYQTRGHELANINPLSLPRKPPYCTSRAAHRPLLLSPEQYGFTAADLDRVFDTRVPGMQGFLAPDSPPRPLRELVKRLKETYCGSMGVEYMHIADTNVCNFIRQKLETERQYLYSRDSRKKILTRMARAQLFENFCASKFATTRRFGLDGCETLIVGMKAITKRAAVEGVESVVIGMAHRGRLNVLVNVMHKPMQQLLSEFQGVSGFGSSEWGNTGDVKYHLGVEFDLFDRDSQRNVHMCILPNPSHLEAVDPLVLGLARAQQYFRKDADRSLVLPILVHGDASLAGQGVVYETLQMCALPNYTVGGAIHLVVNNQIGFTTNPVDSGSGKYCTDIAKAVEAPIIHVNAEDPEAVTFACELALEYRQKFKHDVFVDIVGYRRFGHNELDMPKFTQPLTYTLIARKKPALELYADKLIHEPLSDAAVSAAAAAPVVVVAPAVVQEVVSNEDVDKMKADIWDFYSREYENSKHFVPANQYQYAPQWTHLVTPDHPSPPRVTGVRLSTLRDLGRRIFKIPEGFVPHPTIARVFKQRLAAVEGAENEKALDFGAAENLAYASLLSDGFHVRLAGQDSQRGTFSHRHAVLHDQAVEAEHSIFDTLKDLRLPHSITICNSPLSEYAAMGFEFGYSMEHPDTLSIWEAQFGDFSNGAQIITDQFIASAEVKWNRQNGLVLLLPHGYDGQGPEHSSARIERFLQLCDDREDVIHEENWELSRSSVIQQHNIQVVVPSVPSNTFHVLRRQVHRAFRKPLVVFSPKRMLRMRQAMSSLADIKEGTRFRRYIPDDSVTDPSTIERLILCCGQIYYDLHAERDRIISEEPGPGNPGTPLHSPPPWTKVALARVEQLSPFPFDLVIKDFQIYPNLKSVVWAQEEPMNQGAWFYTSKRIESSLRHLGSPNGIERPIYVGRDVSATTAVGDKGLHDKELAQLLADAFNLESRENSYLAKYLSRRVQAEQQKQQQKQQRKQQQRKKEHTSSEQQQQQQQQQQRQKKAIFIDVVLKTIVLCVPVHVSSITSSSIQPLSSSLYISIAAAAAAAALSSASASAAGGASLAATRAQSAAESAAVVGRHVISGV